MPSGVLDPHGAGSRTGLPGTPHSNESLHRRPAESAREPGAAPPDNDRHELDHRPRALRLVRRRGTVARVLHGGQRPLVPAARGAPDRPQELEREIAATPGAEFQAPGGVLLVARYEALPGGMAGVRMLDATTGELKRVFVRERLRGRGGAALLLTAAEEAARGLGAERLILDTRGDLVEARALYARHGYEETEPHNDETYADHWFTKKLTP